MQSLKADRNHVIALALYHAMNGDTSILERLRQETIELWNGWGI
jgi:hypothetical protein